MSRDPLSPGWRAGARARARALGFGTAAVLLACGLAACSTNFSSSASGGASSGSKTFVAAVLTLPPSMNPSSFSIGERPVFAMLDSSLFNYASSSCSTPLAAANVTGQLVKSWTIAPDRKSYTIVLKQEKSPAGNPLTSTDVQWSLDRALATDDIIKYLTTASAHYAKNPITIISPTEFKLNVTQATPVDLAVLGLPDLPIYDATLVKQHATASDPWASAWLSANFAGFGPWQLSSFQAGNEVVMTKNPGYTGPRGNISQVIMKQIDTAADEVQLMQSGSVQYAANLTWAQYKTLSTSSNVTVYKCAPISRDVLVLNFKNPALGNTDVRQAISMAINRSQLNVGAYAGLASPAVSPLLPSEMPPGDSAPTLSYNVAAAKALLAKAGYPHGFSFTLTYNDTNPGSQADQDAILLQSQLKQAGITLNLNDVTNGSDFSNDFTKGQYQAALVFSGSAVPSAYFDVGLEEPGSPNDSWNFTDSQWVNLVNQVGTSPAGSSASNSALTQLAALGMSQLPWIPLIDTPNIFAMSSSVTGIGAAMRTGTIVPQAAVMNMN